MAEKILITGGKDYIGSHAAVELMLAGFEVVIVDNLCNSSVKVLERLNTICGPNFSFVEADVRDSAKMDAVFAANEITGVIHFATLKYLESSNRSITVNLGTGRGVSVRELADTFARVNQVDVPYAFVPRRAGDVVTSYADTTLSAQELGWTAEYDLVQIFRDIWRWQSANPEGYV